MNEPATRRVILPHARLLAEPDPDSPMDSELLFGETADRLDVHERWTRIRAHADGYEGFIASHAIAGPVGPASHKVCVRATLRLPLRDIKSTPVTRLPLGALLCVEPDCSVCDQGLLPLADGGFVHAGHIAPIGRREQASLVELAQRHFLGAPYLWGGRTPGGCDCSGLVQSVARLAGHALPRDSGPQEASIATAIALEARQPDDLVFWPGHVAVMMADENVMHANAHTFSVAEEPLGAVIARAGRPRSLRRLAAPAPADGPRTGESCR